MVRGYLTKHIRLCYNGVKMKKAILAILPFLLLGPILSAERESDFNPWQSLFTELVETIYIVMEDRMTFIYSSQDEMVAPMTIGRLEKQLRTSERSYKIKDIAVIIHNHLKDCRFSPADYKQHRRLKKYGFRGLFLLYSHTTNKTYDIED